MNTYVLYVYRYIHTFPASAERPRFAPGPRRAAFSAVFPLLLGLASRQTAILLYYTILYCTILYYTTLYYTILHYTIISYSILYCTILFYTTI